MWLRMGARLVAIGEGAEGWRGGDIKKAREACAFRAWIRGGDLLSHFRSIIGATRFNFSVRNGKRWSPRAIATLVRFRFRSCNQEPAV